MERLTSAQGSLSVAIAALLLVLGFRLARPARAREWLATVAYGAALAGQVLGAQGLLPGAALAPGAAARLAGAALLVAGLLLAGRPARARVRAAARAQAAPEPAPGAYDPVHAGLAIVAVGQLVRGPSVAGAIVTLVAVLVNVLVALAPGRRAR